jgi:hypothetical protein
LVVAQRQGQIDEVDTKPIDHDESIEDLTTPDSDDVPKQGPSTEAMSKMTDYSKNTINLDSSEITYEYGLQQ